MEFKPVELKSLIQHTFEVLIPGPKPKLPHNQVIDVNKYPTTNQPDGSGLLLHIDVLKTTAVASSFFGIDDRFFLFLAGIIEEEWGIIVPEPPAPQSVEDENNWKSELNGEIFSLSDFQNVKPAYEPPLRFELVDGLVRFKVAWTSATFKIKGNPVELLYNYEKEYGGLTSPIRNHFSLDHIDKGTTKQARETLSFLQLFKEILGFSQAQKGGRRKGSRPKQTILEYNKICNLRFYGKYKNLSDEVFLSDHPEYNPLQLSRAKKWRKQGKPGLKI